MHDVTNKIDFLGTANQNTKINILTQNAFITIEHDKMPQDYFTNKMYSVPINDPLENQEHNKINTLTWNASSSI